jgi:acetyl esterase/lipase
LDDLSPVKERRSVRRFAAIVAVLLGIFTAGCTPARPPVFYTDVLPITDGAPGTLIRQERIARPPKGSTAYRILYRTRGLDGRIIPVSGMVIIPNGPAPAGGRPVVAWAHPTTGIVPRCGPSLSVLRFLLIPGLDDMLRRGFIVTATDYPGLGTGTIHPFLVGISEGRAVLDSVRAAAALPNASADKRFAIWGHSQGGHAALFAADLAPTYAPKLRLLGVAAAAPATDLAALFRDDLGTKGGNNLTALTLKSWSEVYGASYSDITRPAAQPAIDAIADQCILSIAARRVKYSADKILDHGFLLVPDLTMKEPWRTLIARNTPTLAPGVPVFLAQGMADTIVDPKITDDYERKLCARGIAVVLTSLPGVSHGLTAYKSAKATVDWIADRFAGTVAPSACPLGK